jgi:SAM-dependent methyltransferase
LIRLKKTRRNQRRTAAERRRYGLHEALCRSPDLPWKDALPRDARLMLRRRLATDLAGRVDVVVAFAVAHELPSTARFFAEAAAALKPGGTLLLGEPSGHVSTKEFEGELAEAAEAWLLLSARPKVWRSHAAVLVKR